MTWVCLSQCQKQVEILVEWLTTVITQNRNFSLYRGIKQKFYK